MSEPLGAHGRALPRSTEDDESHPLTSMGERSPHDGVASTPVSGGFWSFLSVSQPSTSHFTSAHELPADLRSLSSSSSRHPRNTRPSPTLLSPSLPTTSPEWQRRTRQRARARGIDTNEVRWRIEIASPQLRRARSRGFLGLLTLHRYYLRRW